MSLTNSQLLYVYATLIIFGVPIVSVSISSLEISTMT